MGGGGALGFEKHTVMKLVLSWVTENARQQCTKEGMHDQWRLSEFETPSFTAPPVVLFSNSITTMKMDSSGILYM